MVTTPSHPGGEATEGAVASYGTDYLQRLLDAVARFGCAFEAWAGTQVESDHLEAKGLHPTVWTREGQDPAEVRRLELDVAEASGEAGRAVAVTGAHIVVAGVGPLDPLANWSLMASPRALFSPHDIRTTVATVRGRLKAMIAEVEARTDDGFPAFSPALMHVVVWNAAAAHWTNHQRRVAVQQAAEALTAHWRHKLERQDVDGTTFWQQTLSPGDPTPDRPKLVWPGGNDRTAVSIRGGLEPLARSLGLLADGLNRTVRNPATHTTAELNEQEAMERLAALSFLARLLDRCEVRRADQKEDAS